jgi:hypothetical protein
MNPPHWIYEEIADFVGLLKRRDLKSARNWLENKKHGLSGDFGRGILRALNGMILSLEGNQNFSLMRRIFDDRISREEIENLCKEFKKRASQKFRPPLERGFDTAWAMVLEKLTGS